MQHSYGAAVALEYAKRYEVEGLVLTGGADHELTPSWERLLLTLILTPRLYLPTNDTLIRQLCHRVGFHESTPESASWTHSNPIRHRSVGQRGKPLQRPSGDTTAAGMSIGGRPNADRPRSSRRCRPSCCRTGSERKDTRCSLLSTETNWTPHLPRTSRGVQPAAACPPQLYRGGHRFGMCDS
jgi:hypothetical protein